MISKISYNFARSAKISHQLIKKTALDQHPSEARMDPSDPSITDAFIAQLHLGFILTNQIFNICQRIYLKNVYQYLVNTLLKLSETQEKNT